MPQQRPLGPVLMEQYPHPEPRDAAKHHYNNYTLTELTEAHLDEMDQIINHLNWTVRNTQSISLYNHQTAEDVDAEAHNTPPFSSQSLLGSPETMADSKMKTPPMPDYELPAEFAAMWNEDALNMMPDLVNYPLDPLLDREIAEPWTNIELACSNVAPAWDVPCVPSPSLCQTSLPPPSQAGPATCSAPPAVETSAEPSQPTYTCTFCAAIFPTATKCKTHTNKHTKPFRCTACEGAFAEKKSLQRHVLARAKYDHGHRAAAGGLGVKDVEYGCTRGGCEYSTIREDNLRRHIKKCAARGIDRAC